MGTKNLILGLIGVAAGFTAVRVYEVSGAAAGVAALLIAAWTLFYLHKGTNILKALGTLLDPFHSGINFLLGGFLYASLQGRGFWPSVTFGIAAALFGIILSMFVYKYWTIGE